MIPSDFGIHFFEQCSTVHLQCCCGTAATTMATTMPSQRKHNRKTRDNELVDNKNESFGDSVEMGNQNTQLSQPNDPNENNDDDDDGNCNTSLDGTACNNCGIADVTAQQPTTDMFHGRKRQSEDVIFHPQKKKKTTNNKLRNARAPGLDHKAVRNFLEGKKTFVHQSYNNTIVPYALPSEFLDLMCYCGKKFKQDSGSAFRKHLKEIPTQCTLIPNSCSHITPIRFQSEEYKRLKNNPQYFHDGKKLTLRIHPECTVLACICGEVKVFDMLNRHMKNQCTSVKKLKERIHQQNCLVPIETYKAEPKLHRHTHSTNESEIHLLRNLKLPLFLSETIQVKNPKKLQLTYCNKYKVYDALGDKSAQIFVPNNRLHNSNESLKSISTKISAFDNLLNYHYDELKNLKCAVAIQGKRLEIVLGKTAIDFDKGHLTKFLQSHNSSFDDLIDITSHCLNFTKLDVGEEKFKHSNMGKFSLIMTKNANDQFFHLDVLGHQKNRQCILILSERSKTTKVCRPKSRETITNTKELAEVLMIGTKCHSSGNRNHPNWLVPSEKLVDLITGMSQKSVTCKNIAKGLGELFKISTANKSKKCDCLDYESVHVSDVSAGTILSLHGNVQHAGSGIEDENTRSILFWTYGNSLYDTDVQHTKLTVAVTMVQELWMHSSVRLELLKLLYYCFITTDLSYRQTCIGCFTSAYSGVPKLFADFNNVPDNHVESVLAVLGPCCKDDELFKEPNKRAQRFKKRSDENVELL